MCLQPSLSPLVAHGATDVDWQCQQDLEGCPVVEDSGAAAASKLMSLEGDWETELEWGRGNTHIN